MKKKLLTSVLALSIVCGAGMSHRAQAAIPVIDMENIAQAVATVTNTLTQIQNQLLELQPLDLQLLQSQISGITQQVNQLKNIGQQAQGLMNQTQGVNQKWEQTFGNMDTLFTNEATITPDAQIAHSRNVAHTLDQTYQDAYRTAKDAADIDQDWQTLQDLMAANQSAVGNKQSMQIQNSLLAQQNVLMMKEVKTLASMSAAMAATNAAQNQEDAQTLARNKKMIEQNDNLSQLGSPLANMKGGRL